MSAAEGVPLTRELLEALMNVAGVLLDQAVGNEPSPGRAEEAARELADACAVLVSACGDSLLVDACAAALAAASGPDAGTGEKCPFCDSSPCEGLDECRSYTAMYHRQAQAKPPASAAAPDARLGEVLADEALEHARYLAGLAQRINDHDPALSHDDEAQAADSDLSNIAVWLKNRAQEWLSRPPTNAPEISTSLVDAPAPAPAGERIYVFEVDARKYQTHKRVLRGVEIKAMVPHFDPSYALLMEQPDGEPDTVVGDGDEVSLDPAGRGRRRFYSVPPATWGAAPEGERRKAHPDCTAARCGDPALNCRPGFPCYSSPRARADRAVAPAPGDASGETAADFESALDAYRDELMSNTRVGASGGLRALEPDRTELRRLYRAATGEVVATGTVTGRSWEGGPVPRFAQLSLTVGDTSRLPLGTPVSLVLRRDKEGV